jgi:hypothetical protein
MGKNSSKQIESSVCVSEHRAAEMLGIAANSLEKDRKEGHLGIPYVRAGRRVIYSLSDLKEWLIENRRYPGETGDKND